MESKTNFTNIDEYISMFSGETKARLEKIRKTIQKAQPEAVETIAYKMPAFKLNGKPLAYFSSFKNHIGFYPPVHDSLKEEVKDYSNERGNLQFQHDDKVPYDLITKIVNKRAEEIRSKS